MDVFIDRQDKLVFLEKEYARKESSLVILYGRRRVGKTALMTKFMENKQAFYFLATEESEQQNRNAFRDDVAVFTGNTLLQAADINRWGPIFEILVASAEGKWQVILLDQYYHYSFLRNRVVSLLSIMRLPEAFRNTLNCSKMVSMCMMRLKKHSAKVELFI